MTIHLHFDAYASAYQIDGELYFLKSNPDVTSVRLLSKSDGNAPAYCVDVEVKDEAVDTVKSQIESVTKQYASEIANVSIVVYAST